MIPQRLERVQYQIEIIALVAAYQSGDILKHDPLGVRPFDDFHCVEEQSAAGPLSCGVGKSFSFACYRYILTRTSEYNNVDVAQRFDLFFGDLGYVAQVRHIRVMVFQDGARKFVDFGDCGAFPTKRFPRNAGGLDSTEQTYETHEDEFIANLFGCPGKYLRLLSVIPVLSLNPPQLTKPIYPLT